MSNRINSKIKNRLRDFMTIDSKSDILYDIQEDVNFLETKSKKILHDKAKEKRKFKKIKNEEN